MKRYVTSDVLVCLELLGHGFFLVGWETRAGAVYWCLEGTGWG